VRHRVLALAETQLNLSTPREPDSRVVSRLSRGGGQVKDA
jgi:hypothetical protein